MAEKNKNSTAWSLFKSRLNQEGRANEWHSYYVRLVKEGRGDQQAKFMSASKFHPLDGSPHELVFTELPDGRIKAEASDGRNAPKGQRVFLCKEDPGDEEAALVDLIESVDQAKRVSGHEALDWAFQCMLVPWSKITADEVPSMGALSYLRWARTDAKNMTAFYQMWSRMLEKKSLADEDARRRDYGEKALHLMDEFDRDMLSPDDEDAA